MTKKIWRARHARPRIFLALLLASMFSACQTIPSSYVPDSLTGLDQSMQSGIVLFSTEATHACLPGVNGVDTVLKIADSGTSYFDNALFTISVDNGFVKGDFGDHPGGLHAISLPPGNYYFAPYRKAFYRSLRLSIPRYDFSVTAGEVVYLGDFYLDSKAHCDDAMSTSVRDEESRDINILAKSNPVLARSAIVKRISIYSGLVPMGSH